MAAPPSGVRADRGSRGRNGRLDVQRPPEGTRILEVNGTEARDQGRRVIVGVNPGDIAEDTGNA